jgi:ElaB/YqjD/DUF883 family membrane-anchored ribosome-binding protein
LVCEPRNTEEIQTMKSARTFPQLANDVEELLDALKDDHGPEVQELRLRVEDALVAARRAIARQHNNAGARIARYASSVDGYINDYPRLAFLSGAVMFGTIGYLAGATARWRD